MKRNKLVRLAAEFVALVVLEIAGLYAMAHWRVMEVILAPGPHSVKLFAGLAVMFVIVRLFLILAAPGWFLARLVLLVTAPLAQAAEPVGATHASPGDGRATLCGKGTQ